MGGQALPDEAEQLACQIGTGFIACPQHEKSLGHGQSHRVGGLGITAASGTAACSISALSSSKGLRR